MNFQKKFEAFLKKSFTNDVHFGNAIVCMKCKRIIRDGDKLNECCSKLSFEVDTKTVVVDEVTGEVTQCSPLKRDI